MAKQGKKVTLEKLAASMNAGFKVLNSKIDSGYKSLDAKIDSGYKSLDAKIDSGLKSLDSKMNVGFKALDSNMTAGFRRAEENREFLARIIAESFVETNSNLKKLDEKVVRLEDGQDNIQLRLDSMTPQFEVTELQRRAKRLEDRAGIRHSLKN